MQKESRVYNDITYTVGEVWEAKWNAENNHGTIIGFSPKDVPIIELVNGSITKLTDESWTKRKEKLKLYLYKYTPNGAFFVQYTNNLPPPCTFVQTIEVEQE